MAQPPSSLNRPKFGVRALGSLVPGVVEPVLAQRGFVSAAILTQWGEIVGPHIAGWTTPLEIRWPKLSPHKEKPQTTKMGVLVIACPGAFALDVKAAEARIVEAVNRRFGWACIASILINQSPRPAPKPAPTQKLLPPQLIATISDRLGDIQNDELRHSLARLGAAIATKEALKK